LKSKGFNSMGMDQDDVILAPYTTIQKRVLAITHLHSINASVIKEEYAEQSMHEIAEILRQNHKLKPDDEDDFNIRSMEEITSTISSVTGMLTLLLAAVAGISLIVGGIGIMNIMLVSVTERTREIGLRMAIGASPVAILLQFLTEAAVLSTMGGLIGIGLGMSGARLVGNINNWPIYVTPSSVIISFGFSAFVGLFFGFYPALRASRLNPIDCLRYE